MKIDSIISFLSISSTFYLVKLLPISPVYPLVLICVVLFISLAKVEFKIDYVTGHLVVIFLLICLMHLRNSNLSFIINFVIGNIAYFMIVGSKHRLRKPEIEKAIRYFAFFVLITHGLDSVYRISNPITVDQAVLDAWSSRNTLFYMYKFNSLMYGSSNTTAIVCMCALFSIFAIDSKTVIDKIYAILLFLVILSTFSRAVIIASTIGLLIIPIPERNRFHVIILVSVTTIFAGAFLISFLSDDISFNTKLDLFNRVLSYIRSSPIEQLLFGVGAGNSFLALGMFSHLMLLTFFVEAGFLGSLYVIIFITANIMKPKCTLCIFILLIAGLSYYPYWGIIPVFVSVALLNILSTKEKNVQTLT